MRRTRRLSMEVIRREISLSLIGPGEARSQGYSGPSSVDGAPAPECPACRSHWFMLPAGNSKDSAIMQRVLETHAIHNQMLPSGELLVCAKSFASRAGTSKIRNSADTTPSQSNQLSHEKSPNHD